MKVLCAAVGLAAAASTLAWAQTPVFRAGVDAVRVDVSVMNGTAPVLGLTAVNFGLTDSGVAQTIDNVSVDTVPLSIMLVLDSSGSLMGRRLTHLIEGARGLIQSLKPEDSASLFTFSEPVELVVPMTRDRAPLLKALEGMTAYGATSLHDAVFLALQMRPQEASDARSVMLVFSDGRDTASWLSRASSIETMRRSGVVAHVVELTAEGSIGGRLTPSSSWLQDLASAGGGRRWEAHSSGDLRELFAKVLNELRSRYLLTYYPSNVTREGWHDVKVTLKGPRGEVIARPGYFVPASK